MFYWARTSPRPGPRRRAVVLAEEVHLGVAEVEVEPTDAGHIRHLMRTACHKRGHTLYCMVPLLN